MKKQELQNSFVEQITAIPGFYEHFASEFEDEIPQSAVEEAWQEFLSAVYQEEHKDITHIQYKQWLGSSGVKPEQLWEAVSNKS